VQNEVARLNGKQVAMSVAWLPKSAEASPSVIAVMVLPRIQAKMLCMKLTFLTLCLPGRVKTNDDTTTGNRVRVIVRFFPFCNPDESPIEWIGTIVEIEKYGAWVLPDGEEREEFVAICEVEKVQLL
jgi:hypothetical protein